MTMTPAESTTYITGATADRVSSGTASAINVFVSFADVSDRSGPTLMIPRSQVYFWSPTWQAWEREADADIAAGNVAGFDDPMDMVKWLMDVDEDA